MDSDKDNPIQGVDCDRHNFLSESPESVLPPWGITLNGALSLKERKGGF